MTSDIKPQIVIQGARTNNLKNITLSIPHNKLIVVTGVSGSGKSSLVFEVIAKEGQRRYFETLPSFARQYMGKLNRPDVDSIEGLSPVITIGQTTTGMHPRSTVGTMSDIYDLLRLLYARTGSTEKNIDLTRALFSFNSEVGKCRRCNGIGQEEQIDINRLIAHPDRSIRDGALSPTLPNGYIMYSQVTIDVLNQVCEAEGFSVDIPWSSLTHAQQNVILYGSEKIQVPFGKHSLESRLKWTGIKAKPRQEGYYRGMIPIMSDILKRDRNANILKYVHAITCPDCHGTRLNDDALSVTIHKKSIAEISTMQLSELKAWIKSNNWTKIAKEVVQKIEAQINILEDLGLGHLTLDRSARTLRASEIQRIRVANQLLVPLSDVLYVFDEPSIGLHPEENKKLIYHFRQLVRKGNTVIVVEHDLDTIKNADHIIEMGPAAGINGGEVVNNGSFSNFLSQNNLLENSPTFRALKSKNQHDPSPYSSTDASRTIRLLGCHHRNLNGIDVEFQIGKLNVISGRSGVGKSSLVKGTLLPLVQKHLGIDVREPINLSSYENIEHINKLIFIDHSPIGKTPRSNPATYLGISDHIRDLYASLPESKSQGFTKSRFSFNTSSGTGKGGRCEACQGAGRTQIGMHFLGNVDIICSECNGDRFNKATLKIKYKKKSIADIYKLSINEAISFFEDQKKVVSGLNILKEIGLGYLTLGQSSTTLSGGEAQRIKIANQLQKKDTGDTLYIIVEPSIGLHYDDINSLLHMFDRIKQKGNTIVCIEQDETVIEWANCHINLDKYKPVPHNDRITEHNTQIPNIDWIEMQGITTHGLKNIDVKIPKNQLTVVTGLSGSGKSSLVYDTLFAESNARFTESLSTYNRSFLQQNSEAEITSYTGLGPAIGINRKGGTPSKRSTVGTLSGIYDSFRLLYSRIAQYEGSIFTAQHFSYNHHLGACPLCEGMGIQYKCDPNEIISASDKSIFDGAIATNKAIGYYADMNGQFMATLVEVANQKNWNLNRPWKDLESEIKDIILYGTGKKQWSVTWHFTTKSRTGTQNLTAKWLGFCNYIDEEYHRKRKNKNINALEVLLHNVECPSCRGSRLKPELLQTKFLNKNIHELTQLSITSCLLLLEETTNKSDTIISAISDVVLPQVIDSLKVIKNLGLGYLNLNRSISSLSGGERQRVTLAGQLSTHLFGVIYVLDEPTIGLDVRQVEVLSQILKAIVNNGNTVVVVEHDPKFIKSADYIIEMGPGAGSLGGEVIFQGLVKDIGRVESSVTNRMLHAEGELTHKKPAIKHLENQSIPFGIMGASANNLKNIDVDFQSNQKIAIKGVSGSGKSSLIKDVLYNSWIKNRPTNCNSVYGLHQFDEIKLIDQTALPQSRQSTPLSFTGMIDHLKTIFSKTECAKSLGLKRADFSYLSKNGKCPTCAGYGKLKTSMDFMSDIWLTCDSCWGLRYNDTILSCLHKGRNIGEVLQMTVLEAINHFDSGTIVECLDILNHVGVGHLILGQSGNTLSGGEAQRLKLATSMLKKRNGATLYLFDEPSTGLHYFDILKLITVFDDLVESGDTILYIEHNHTLIDAADQVIGLGPGSGDEGGTLVI